MLLYVFSLSSACLALTFNLSLCIYVLFDDLVTGPCHAHLSLLASKLSFITFLTFIDDHPPFSAPTLTCVLLFSPFRLSWVMGDDTHGKSCCWEPPWLQASAISLPSHWTIHMTYISAQQYINLSGCLLSLALALNLYENCISWVFIWKSVWNACTFEKYLQLPVWTRFETVNLKRALR